MNKANIVDLYKRALNDLHSSRIMDKVKRDHLLISLRELAFKDLSCSNEIVEAIRLQADMVDLDAKIVIIDLIHSMVSSIKGEYKGRFDVHIGDIFFSAYIHADKRTRAELFDRRDKWDPYFSKEILNELDDTMRNADSDYPIVKKRPEQLAMHKEKVSLLISIEQLKKDRDALIARMGQHKEVSVVQRSKPLNPVNEMVQNIEKPQPSIEKPSKKVESSNDESLSSGSSSSGSDGSESEDETPKSSQEVTKENSLPTPQASGAVKKSMPEMEKTPQNNVPESLSESSSDESSSDSDSSDSEGSKSEDEIPVKKSPKFIKAIVSPVHAESINVPLANQQATKVTRPVAFQPIKRKLPNAPLPASQAPKFAKREELQSAKAKPPNAPLSKSQARKNIVKPTIRPISGYLNEKPMQTKANSRQFLNYELKSLTDESSSDSEFEDKSPANTCRTRMKTYPQRPIKPLSQPFKENRVSQVMPATEKRSQVPANIRTPDNLQRINGASGNASMPGIGKRSHAIVKPYRYRPKEMNFNTAPVANKVIKRPIPAIN